jgi:glycolate oxidase
MLRRNAMRRGVPGGAPRSDPLVEVLRAAIGANKVRDDAAERSLLSRDASIFRGGVSGPVCFPETTADVRAIMRIAVANGRAVVPRGAGTGLAGGAIPLGAPIVVALTKMNRILEVDTDNRVAWVEPGVVNLDLTRHLTPYGFHFAPDPSSQQVCTIGGNVAENSGGAHCL